MLTSELYILVLSDYVRYSNTVENIAYYLLSCRNKRLMAFALKAPLVLAFVSMWIPSFELGKASKKSDYYHFRVGRFSKGHLSLFFGLKMIFKHF